MVYVAVTECQAKLTQVFSYGIVYLHFYEIKTIVTETALKTKFWSAAIRTVAYFLGNGFTVPQPRP